MAAEPVVRDVLAGKTIGSPYMITGSPVRQCEIYGRLTGFAGNEYHGEYPRVVITTPHGTDITSGRVWCHLITDPEELAKLHEFEEVARQRPSKAGWYAGKLPQETP